MKYVVGFIVGAMAATALTALAQYGYPSPQSIAIGVALSGDSGDRRSMVGRIEALEKRVTALEKK